MFNFLHGIVHKQQVLKKKMIFNCDNCKWIGKSQKLLDKHKINLHIEQVKRKITQEQPYKCYICGFMSISETAFKIHTEESHNQIYIIQRTNSITKSPPMKKPKDFHPLTTEEAKEKEIICLQNIVNDLEQKLVQALKVKKQALIHANTSLTTLKPQEVVSHDPNLKELPASVKPLVEEGSQEFVVKGDGPCFLRTTPAHIAGDEKNGPELARDLNTHQPMYRSYYEQKISADFPLKVTIGVQGQFKVFENSANYFDWLLESREAAYMWRGCMDVIATSNMTNMDIDIIIYEEGQIPETK